MSPLVSVVLPFHNAERTLLSSIRSVLDQTHKNIEVILVNDGSNDRSLDVLSRINDTRIIVLSQANAGPSCAANAGFKYAHGEYVALIDSDDLWAPNKLERHLNHFSERPEVGVSFNYSQFIDQEGNPLNYFQRPKLTNITPRDLLCHCPVSNGSTGILRKKVLDAIEFSYNGSCAFADPRTTLAHDLEMWLRIGVATSWIIEGIPEILSYYRISKESYSSSFYLKLSSLETTRPIIERYARDLVQTTWSAAVAYQCRYLARRALYSGLRFAPLHYALLAIRKYPYILFEDPRRTLSTLTCSLARPLIPSSVWKQLLSFLKIIHTAPTKIKEDL